jgi:hypothetical protein
MAVAATTIGRVGRLGGLVVAALLVLILLSFARSGAAPDPSAVPRSKPVPPPTGARAPVVEPDPRKDNVVRGVTSQVTIEAPVRMAHHGHHHHT